MKNFYEDTHFLLIVFFLVNFPSIFVLFFNLKTLFLHEQKTYVNWQIFFISIQLNEWNIFNRKKGMESWMQVMDYFLLFVSIPMFDMFTRADARTHRKVLKIPIARFFGPILRWMAPQIGIFFFKDLVSKVGSKSLIHRFDKKKIGKKREIQGGR